MSKISVIIPVYNMETYLPMCLDSIERQTMCGDLEVVCINDGSLDDSLLILREYEDRYNNIVLINQFNSGVAEARNAGIRAATGEYVAFMDPDDYYPEEDSLEILYQAAKEQNVSICGGSFSMDHGEYIQKEWDGIYSKYTFDQDELINYRDYQFDYGYHRFLYRRQMLLDNDIWFPPYTRFQDPPFFVRAMITAGSFYGMRKTSYCYRLGQQHVKWNERKTADLIRGLTDNLRYSSQNDLRHLHCITAWRLLCEDSSIIGRNLGDRDIVELLFKAKDALKEDWLKSTEVLSAEMVYDIISSGFNDIVKKNNC